MKAQIRSQLQRITDLLISKNESYGNSATKPAGIFSKGNAMDSICARIDDKLMRIANAGINEKTLDTIDDLMGYLVLLKIAYSEQQNKQ